MGNNNDLVALLKQVIAGELTPEQASNYPDLVSNGVVFEKSETQIQTARKGMVIGPRDFKKVSVSVWTFDLERAKELLKPALDEEAHKSLVEEKRKHRKAQNEVDGEIPPVDPNASTWWQRKHFGLSTRFLIPIVISLLILIIAIATFFYKFVFNNG